MDEKLLGNIADTILGENGYFMVDGTLLGFEFEIEHVKAIIVSTILPTNTDFRSTIHDTPPVFTLHKTVIYSNGRPTGNGYVYIVTSAPWPFKFDVIYNEEYTDNGVQKACDTTANIIPNGKDDKTGGFILLRRDIHICHLLSTVEEKSPVKLVMEKNTNTTYSTDSDTGKVFINRVTIYVSDYRENYRELTVGDFRSSC